MTDLVEQILDEEEGSTPWVIKDTRGYYTIARGICVDKRVTGAGLPAEAIAAANQVRTNEARKRAAELPGFDRCNDVRQAVLVSLCFQLGSMEGWPHFRACLAAGDYEGAADNVLYADVATETPSDLLKETPNRCRREAQMLRTGLWVQHK